MVPLGVGDVDRLIESAVGKSRATADPGALDGAVVEVVEVSGGSSAADSNSQSLLPSQPKAPRARPMGAPRILTVKW